MKTWRDKAHKRIAGLSLQSFEQVNRKRDGSYYKRRRPYSIPEEAQELIRLLGSHNEQEAEREAKSIFVHGWDLHLALKVDL